MSKHTQQVDFSNPNNHKITSGTTNKPTEVKMSKLTAVQWFFDKIKSHFEHDGDLLETLTFTMEIAKEMEQEQIIGAANNGCKGMCMIDTSRDGKQYYNETYGGNLIDHISDVSKMVGGKDE